MSDLRVSRRALVGADGCRDGWLAVVERGDELTAWIAPDFAALLSRVATDALIGIDIPIGLPDRGSRQCDIEARKLLGRPRRSSVFPAPLRSCLRDGTYAEVSAIHRYMDGRGMTKQTYSLLGKIREVDRCTRADHTLQERVREVHPELSFYHWNREKPMVHKKSRVAGRQERERLIEQVWPGERQRLMELLNGRDFKPDDLNDAFAALWSVRRMMFDRAIVVPCIAERDGAGSRMEIVA